MKQVFLLALAAMTAQLGAAASCSSGSLASYVALGSTGCTIGTETLYNFKILPGTAGATELAGGSVSLSAMGGNLNPGLTISVNQSATGGATIETMFTYDISGPVPYTGIWSALSGSSESTPADGVSGIVNFCEGGNFGADGVDGCTMPNGSLLTIDGTQNTDMGSLGNVSLLNITDDFTLTSGGGTATGGTLTNSLTEVPEPVTTALAGFALALAGAIKVRTLRTQKETK